MKKLVLIWLIGTIALVMMSYVLKFQSTSFHGIADAKEIVINNEYPVEIVKINVVPGQSIKTDEVVLELKSQELEEKILGINYELQTLTTQLKSDHNINTSLIGQYKAQKAAKYNEINSYIQELEAQQKMNKELTSELKSVGSGLKTETGSVNNIGIKINNLKKDLVLATAEYDVMIKELQVATRKGVNTQIENLKEQLDVLKASQNKMVVTSPINGLIGSVNYRGGEKVSPFDSIMTLHPKSPVYVRGYIHENVYNSIEVGREVTVTSITVRKNQIKGHIVGIGSRIVECPARLWKRPDIAAFGREVQIKIPEDNPFLLGEKVLITTSEVF